MYTIVQLLTSLINIQYMVPKLYLIYVSLFIHNHNCLFVYGFTMKVAEYKSSCIKGTIFMKYQVALRLLIEFV